MQVSFFLLIFKMVLSLLRVSLGYQHWVFLSFDQIRPQFPKQLADRIPFHLRHHHMHFHHFSFPFLLIFCYVAAVLVLWLVLLFLPQSWRFAWNALVLIVSSIQVLSKTTYVWAECHWYAFFSWLLAQDGWVGSSPMVAQCALET